MLVRHLLDANANDPKQRESLNFLIETSAYKRNQCAQ